MLSAGLRRLLVAASAYGAVALTGLSLLPAAAAQADPVPRIRPVEMTHTPRPVVVDGALDEWGGLPVAVRIDREEQVWNPAVDAEWRGMADLSAEVWVGVDRAHVYVAGRVQDNSFVAGRLDRGWHQQDAVEVFFDPRVDRREQSLEQLVQIFVMPFSEERRWGRIDWKSNRPAGASSIGVQAATRVEESSYTFELVVPLSELGVAEDLATIGFDIALDDHDEDTDRYQYMTLTGENPVRAKRPHGLLELGGTESDRGVGAGAASSVFGWVRHHAGFVLALLGGVLALWLLLRVGRTLEQRVPWSRPAMRALGVAALLGGVLLPTWLVERRHAAFERDLRDVVTVLQSGIDRIGEGVLGSYGGAERDRAFATLLDGGRIAREKQYAYTNLRDLSDDGGAAVTPARRHGALGYSVLPYNMPLEAGAVERFDFREPLQPGFLNVTVGRPIEVPEFGEAIVAPRLLATLVDTDARTETVELEFSGSYFPSRRLAANDVEVSFRTVSLDREIRAVVLSEPEGDGLELVGLTWASGDLQEERPLSLGEPSLGGVATDLRGAWPLTAGFELGSGRNHSIPVPAGHAFDRMWLFYRASYPGRPTLLRPGDTVCELRVWERGRSEARLIEFRHQESMFFELELQNQEPPQVGDVGIGLRWLDENQEARVNFVRSLDLGAELERLEFRNVGPYSIRFRSVVFGDEVRSVSVSTEESPLARDSETGMDYLKPEFLAKLRGSHVAMYRSGRMTASTSNGTRDGALAKLPADLGRVALDEPHFVRATAGDAADYRAYTLLGGGEFSGAVFCTSMRDLGAGDYARWVHRVGIAMSLGSVPILLLLFSSVLSMLGNLRLRLIAVFAVVMLVPLGLLSFVLIDVLEGAYEDEMRDRLAQSLAGARATLQAEQDSLRVATQSWVRDLADEFEAATAAAGRDAEAALRSTLASQRPPAWGDDGGFLLFEFDPADVPGAPEALRVFLGPSDLRELDTPLRSEPGLYVTWSVPILGVRADLDLPSGSCSLSVGRRVGSHLLDGAASERGDVVLCAMNGYDLDVIDTTRRAVDPTTVRDRAAAGEAVLAGGAPIVRYHEVGAGRRAIATYDVLRDLQDTPRALLGVVERYDGAGLPLRMGRVPVREFFIATAVLLVVASLFLGWVITTRISKPIEELERGAREISQGDFDVRIATEERGQIGRLTRTFNRMSEELRSRLDDLHSLNRGIRDLTSRLEQGDVLAHALTFYARHTAADGVRIVLRDRVRPRVEVYGGADAVDIDASDTTIAHVLASAGAFSMRLDGASEALVAALGRGMRSAVVLPLAVGGRTHGAVFLLFEAASPPDLNLELHTTMAVQVTAALENARLYRSAVEDLYTGAHRPEFFASRVAHAVRDAQADGGSVTLVGIRIAAGQEIAKELGQARHGEFLARLCGLLRQELGADALLCRAADDELVAMIADCSREEAERAVTAIRQGAGKADFDLPRPHHALRLTVAVARYPEEAASSEFLFDTLATRLAHDATGSEPVQRRLRQAPVEGAFLDSPAMEGVFRTLERFAPTDISLLLEGETGVGKEMLTNLVHAWSKRASGPLIKVHCAALPESLLQSELFGHEKGAFTGATERKVGRFEQADGGTIFLDEVGEISLDVQVQLLRVLQEREIERVGGKQPIPVDVRIIAATNRNLRDMVAAGAFREDLYYRLQGMVVVVPPLRERRAEIPHLIEHFRREAVAAGQTSVRGFAADAIDELFRRSWPGNIRELRNEVFRAMVFANGEQVTRADLIRVVPSGEAAAAPVIPRPPVAADGPAEDPADVSIPMPEPAEPAAPAGGPAGGDDPGDRLDRLVAWVAERGTVSTAEYAAAAGISPRTALRDLGRLQAEGRLERIGKRRGARYRVANSAGST